MIPTLRLTLAAWLFFVLGACGQPATGQPDRTVQPAPPAEILPIALQLYTLRDYGTLDDKLELAASVGFSGVEIYQTYDLGADALARKAAEHGLAITSWHVGLGTLRYDLENTVRYAQSLGVDTLILPWLKDEERPNSGAGWSALGRELGDYGRRLAREGLTLGYHNHAFEMAELEGKSALEWLFEGASAEDLKWQPDVAWIRLGGRNPATLINTYSERVVSMHAKGVAEDPGEEGGFADVGYGTLDWTAILRAAEGSPLEWYIVEHDQPTDPEKSVARSFAYLETALRD